MIRPILIIAANSVGLNLERFGLRRWWAVAAAGFVAVGVVAWFDFCRYFPGPSVR